MSYLEDYKTLRRQNVRAKVALSCAKEYERLAAIIKQPIIELETSETSYPKATWEQDGFTIQCHMEPDAYPDLSWLGEFSNTWVEGAIPHEPDNTRTFNWFIPTTSYEDHLKALQDSKQYVRGECDRLARQYVQRDYQRMCSYGVDWELQTVCCQVFKGSVELGSSSLSGFGDLLSDDEIIRYFREVGEEALEQAKTTLSKLKEE